MTSKILSALERALRDLDDAIARCCGNPWLCAAHAREADELEWALLVGRVPTWRLPPEHAERDADSQDAALLLSEQVDE